MISRMVIRTFILTACVAALSVVVLGVVGSLLLASDRGWSIILLTVCTLLLIASVFFICTGVERLKTRSYRLLLAVLLMISLLCSFGMFFVLAGRDIGWDPGVLFWIAEEHIEGKYLGGYWGERYFSRYENNIFIGLVIISLAKLASFFQTDVYLLAIVINAFLMFLSSLLIMYAANILLGRRGVVVAWVFSLGLIAFSSWVGTFYTDTLGLFFVSLVIALMLQFGRTRKYLLAALLGTISAIGFLIKPTVIIVVLAMIISIVIISWSKKIKINYRDYRQMAVFAVLFFMIIFSFNIFSNKKVVNDNELVEKVGLSADHFLAMGSLRGLSPYTYCSSGGYCNELLADLDNRDDLANKDARRELYLKLLNDSLFTDFPIGYFAFAMGKVATSFGDGSFLVWMEGVAEPRFFFNQPLIKNIRTHFYGTGMSSTRYVWQVLWMGILIFMIIAIIFNIFKQRSLHYKIPWVILGFMITLIGIALYQVLFESRSRYIFLYLPVFILLAGYGALYLVDMIQNRVKLTNESSEDGCP